ncbi:hypothetical protein K7432_006605 [Basidiobolus ranarum]|uniref:Uncharacterized protein n=1 Tax=Basidiobolus ranarum TaxID=34480 RepID=A0ABR2WUV9_9FUNG
MQTPFLDTFLAQNSLKLCSDDKKIRRLVSERNFQPGDLVIFSPPLATFPLPEYRSEICDFCFKESEDLLRCSGCSEVHYCSTTCQTKAWKKYHKWSCKLWEIQKDNDSLMLRRAVFAIHSKPSVLKYQYDQEYVFDERINQEAFESLSHHSISWDQQTKRQFLTISSQTLKALISTSFPIPPNLTVTSLGEYLGRFQCNNFTSHDLQLFPVGEGTYPIGSLFNHSCIPNCIVMYDKGVQIVRSISPIKAGEELCIAYVDSFVPRTRRRTQLQEKYYFECECELCSDPILSKLDYEHDNAIDENDLPLLKPGSEISNKSKSIVSSFYTQKPENHEDIQRSIISSLEDSFFTLSCFKHVTPFHREALSSADWVTAGETGWYILSMYLLRYPRNHPLTGLHAFTLAKCLWNCPDGDISECVRLLKLAHSILTATHGCDSQVIKEIIVMSDMLRRETHTSTDA